MRPQAQQLDSHMGKILRITPDGPVPRDNPFVGQASARREIWSLGHRNVQAAAFDAQGRLWVVEHGTRRAATSSTWSRRARTTAGR